jgi:hypothetical protein
MAYSPLEKSYMDSVAEYLLPQANAQPDESDMQLASSNQVMSDAPGIVPIPQTGFEKVMEKTGLTLEQIGSELDKIGKLNIGGVEIGIRDLLPFVGSIEDGKLTGTPAALQAAGRGESLITGTGFTTQLKPDAKMMALDVATAGVAKPMLQAGKAAAKGVAKALPKDLPVGMSIKMLDGTDAVVPKAPAIDTPAFNNWFAESKVVDEAGAPIAVYHGTGRPDRVGEQFRKSRATSGPMSFFTDNPEVASGYAKGKTDTSITYEDDAFDYKNWFKKKAGRSELNLEQAGARMSQQERNAVIEKLKDISVDEDTGEIIYKQGGGSIMGSDTFNWYLNRESNGNPLVAANKIWLESGQLYGKEEEFAKVLQLAGVKGFEYNDPHAKFPFVYKVFLSIKNPLDTANLGEDVISSLEEASKRVRKPTQRGGADQWDKNTVAPKDWIERLKSDQAEGTTHAWTSIPDWVTKTLKAKGFDGIKDSGGKGGGTAHNVWIPFEENQVKSALGNQGTFSESKNIMRGVGVGGTGAAATQEENK